MGERWVNMCAHVLQYVEVGTYLASDYVHGWRIPEDFPMVTLRRRK